MNKELREIFYKEFKADIHKVRQAHRIAGRQWLNAQFEMEKYQEIMNGYELDD